MSLAACTLFCAAVWWYARNTADWEPVPARVVGLSLIENNHQISAARPYLQIHFEYSADGQTFRGSTRLDTFMRAMYRAVPEDVIELLHSKGYMSFADLPADVQAMLRGRGIETLEDVPEPLLEALRAQGVNSVRDFPKDIQNLSRHGNNTSGVPAAGHGESGNSLAGGRVVAPVDTDAIILVRYDPRDPLRHVVARFPQLRGAIWPILLGLFATLTVLYCGVLYPRIKLR